MRATDGTLGDYGPDSTQWPPEEIEKRKLERDEEDKKDGSHQNLCWFQ